MRVVLLAVLGLFLTALLNGCSADPALLAKQDERRLAAEMFAAIERGRSDASDFPVPAGSSLRSGAYRGLATNVPRGKPVLVGVQRFAGTAGNRALLIYSVEAPGDHGLVTFVMVRGGGSVRVERVGTEKLPRQLSELRRFRLTDAGPGTLAMLLLPLLSIGIALAAILRIWRSGRFGRRWLWTLGCLLGLCELRLLWPTGRFFLQPLYISILPAGVRPIGPYPDNWLIAASLPVVAIVALLIRRRPADQAVAHDRPTHPETPATH
jgi:hypothetical protein